MEKERILHTIKMVNRKDGAEVVYQGVKNYDTTHGGCVTELNFPDGSTASFEKSEWELWDLTPQKGWNCNIPIFHTEGDKSNDCK